jgi:hypothetical protein
MNYQNLLQNRWTVTFVLFVTVFAIYWFSIPDQFNTIYSNREYFDSDGEFIVRQFNQGKTFTHNDHLLYHISGKFIYNHAEWFPKIQQDPVEAHKLLSAFFGALGVGFLYLLGLSLTGSSLFALAAALLIGGSAGWYFFSATIDTYIPCLTISIAALALGLRALRDQKTVYFAALGAAMGLAFLLRTDSFLLGVLGIFLWQSGRKIWRHSAALILSGLVVGVFGYFLLAKFVYGIEWGNVPAWCLGGLDRPEAIVALKWGVLRNLSFDNFWIVLVNHVFYVILLPALMQTRNPQGWQDYFHTASGAMGIGLFAALLVIALFISGLLLRRSWRAHDFTCPILILVGLLWFFPRIVFYTWWDPYDPFLFAVMNLPAIWLLVMCFGIWSVKAPARIRLGSLVFIWLVAATVWWHNIETMITPLRNIAG